jgi:taurine dioxygenase
MISIRRTNAPLGAEIQGIDLTGELDDAILAAIVDAWHEHEVIFFRGQTLSPEQHVCLSRRLGELELHVRSEFAKPGHPEIFVVSNMLENGKPIGASDAGATWHSDSCCRREPSSGSLLYARQVPRRDGKMLGDTLFSSMTAAYEALPDEMKMRLRGLRCVNSIDNGYTRVRRNVLDENQRSRVPGHGADVEHPVVRVHPHTGRKCIYVNESYTTHIVGLSADDSRALLDILTAHVTQPQFVYRHNWQVGDLLMWDNCSTQHKAMFDYAPLHRLMERTTLQGILPLSDVEHEPAMAGQV